MFKLSLLVITGTIVAWIVVLRLMTSTDHMPDTFSAETTRHLERGATGDKGEENEEPVLTTQSVSASRSSQSQTPASVRERQRNQDSGPQRPGPSPDEQGLRIDSAEIISDRSDDDALEPLDGLRRLPIDDAEQDEAEAEFNEQDSSAQSNNSEEPVRSDSDADIAAAEAEERAIEAAEQIRNDRVRATNNNTTTPRKKAESIKAIDLAYALPAQTDCVLPTESYPQIAVSYRPSSFAIKGQSLTSIDQLIKLHRKCKGGKFIVLQNETDEEDLDEKLIKLRQDEVKYYLLQRRIPKDDIILPDES